MVNQQDTRALKFWSFHFLHFFFLSQTSVNDSLFLLLILRDCGCFLCYPLIFCTENLLMASQN